MKNILHVPQIIIIIIINLLSASKLTSNNDVFVELHSSFCLIKDKTTRKVSSGGTFRDGLYYIETHKSTPMVYNGVWSLPKLGIID